MGAREKYNVGLVGAREKYNVGFALCLAVSAQLIVLGDDESEG